MESLYPTEWPQFFTATINCWKDLFKEDNYKNVITQSLLYLKEKKKVKINAFVIMNNHVHFIWQAMPGNSLKQVQTSFSKHTAKEFMKLLKTENKLKDYEVHGPDRKYSFWKRDPLGIELFTPAVYYQKLNYIHNNPVRAGLCSVPEAYYYSSALFYEKGIDHFNLLEHWAG